MPLWQRAVAALMSIVLLAVVDEFEAPMWLALPAVVVLALCLPSAIELALKFRGGREH